MFGHNVLGTSEAKSELTKIAPAFVNSKHFINNNDDNSNCKL